MPSFKAAVFRKPNEPLSIGSVDLDEPLAGEVLIRTRATGRRALPRIVKP
jgi:Zn-dependent alcohol dehydrogenase